MSQEKLTAKSPRLVHATALAPSALCTPWPPFPLLPAMFSCVRCVRVAGRVLVCMCHKTACSCQCIARLCCVPTIFREEDMGVRCGYGAGGC